MSWFTDLQEQAKKTLGKTLEKAVQQVDRVLDIQDEKGAVVCLSFSL